MPERSIIQWDKDDIDALGLMKVDVLALGMLTAIRRALAAIARRAIKRRTGARGLRSIVESLLLDIMYDLPSLNNLQRVVIDETTIENNARPLLIYSEPSKVA